MRRRNHGLPLREAMRSAGLTIEQLAAETGRIDPQRGLSTAMVGFIVGSGRSARDQCSDRAAFLIAEALKAHATLDSLFETEPITAPPTSTSTERSSEDVPTVTTLEPMVTVAELAGLIKKSRSWIYEQIRERNLNGFPVEYAGSSPRFFFSEVRAWMRADAIKSGRLAA